MLLVNTNAGKARESTAESGSNFSMI